MPLGPSPRTRPAHAVARPDPTWLRRLLLAAGLLGLLTIGDGFLYLVLAGSGTVGATYFPLLMVGTNAAYLALAVPLGRLADRMGRTPVFIGGYVLLLAGTCCVRCQVAASSPLSACSSSSGPTTPPPTGRCPRWPADGCRREPLQRHRRCADGGGAQPVRVLDRLRAAVELDRSSSRHAGDGPRPGNRAAGRRTAAAQRAGRTLRGSVSRLRIALLAVVVCIGLGVSAGYFVLQRRAAAGPASSMRPSPRRRPTATPCSRAPDRVPRHPPGGGYSMLAVVALSDPAGPGWTCRCAASGCTRRRAQGCACVRGAASLRPTSWPRWTTGSLHARPRRCPARQAVRGCQRTGPWWRPRSS